MIKSIIRSIVFILISQISVGQTKDSIVKFSESQYVINKGNVFEVKNGSYNLITYNGDLLCVKNQLKIQSFKFTEKNPKRKYAAYAGHYGDNMNENVVDFKRRLFVTNDANVWHEITPVEVSGKTLNPSEFRYSINDIQVDTNNENHFYLQLKQDNGNVADFMLEGWLNPVTLIVKWIRISIP
jgi:hypothetical protein